MYISITLQIPSECFSWAGGRRVSGRQSTTLSKKALAALTRRLHMCRNVSAHSQLKRTPRPAWKNDKQL